MSSKSSKVQPLSIKDFKGLINSMPIDQHAFTVNKKSWRKGNHKLIQSILSNYDYKDEIIVKRSHLRGLSSIENFIILTLMWGYPTKGRGNNINQLLEEENFILLQDTLASYKKENTISNPRLIKNLKTIKSCGISTMSKFLCFLDIKVDGYQSIILDRQIIRVLGNRTFIELDSLSHLTYSNGHTNYSNYLKTINDVSCNIGVTPEKLEMFLFIFGRNLA